MSKIRDMKSDDQNIVNVIDFAEMIISSDKTKYIELFIKLFKNSIEEKYPKKSTEVIELLSSLFPEMKEDFQSYSTFKCILTSYLFDILYDTNFNIEIFNNFIDLNEKKLIDNNDLTTYQSYDHIHTQVLLCQTKLQEKELEKQVVKIYDDENWLLIKPLTSEASIKYGYGTKWCTSSEKDKSYFNKYTKEGCLIYFINKKTNRKIAAYKKMFNENLKPIEPEISFWDEKDRKIDSFDSGLSNYVLDILREYYVKHDLINYNVLENQVVNNIIATPDSGSLIHGVDYYGTTTPLNDF